MAVYKADILDVELNTGNIARSFLCHNIGKDDQKADRFGVRCFRDGEPVSLSGVSIQGFMLRPNGSHFHIHGSANTGVSGNEAWVDLPQEAYDYEGQFCLALKLIGGEVTGTIRIIDGMVNNTFVDGAVAPTAAVPTYQEILSVYDQMVAAKAGSVRFDEDQSLTAAQKTKARGNIEAASERDVADLKSAINGKALDIGSYNRFDKSTVSSGIIDKTGAITQNSQWSYSDFIPVEPGMVLYAGGHSVANFAMYDISKTIVPNNTNWANPFTVPANVQYIRMTFQVINIDVAYLSTQDSYDQYKTVVVYLHDVESNSKSARDLDTQKTVEFSVSGVLNKDSGMINTNSNYKCTDYLPLSGILTKIKFRLKTISNIAEYCFYDQNKNFISSGYSSDGSLAEVEGIIDAFPSNAAYIVFCTNSENGYIPYIGAVKLGDIVLHGKVVNVDNITFTEHNKVTNLIDKSKLVLGYINGSTDGSVNVSATMYVTGYIPLEAEKQYYFNANYLYRGYCAFYNANKEYISGYGASSASVYLPSPFTTPQGTAFGRFTIATESRIANAWICETNQMAEKPVNYSEQVKTEFVSAKPTDYTGNEICVFNKILCIGDSLTDGFFNESGGSRLIIRNRSYPAKLQSLTGIECTNMGYAGYTSAQWYTAYSSEDLSGHDACIIQLGVNDELQNISESDMDTAFSNIISKVKSDNPGIKIFVATIIPGNGYMTTGMRSRSQMIRDFVSGLNDADVFLVDLWAYGHTDDCLGYDAGHLSALGYLRLADDYKAYISYIIHNSPDDFRYVQFIGTNYRYSGSTEVRAITY